LDVLLILVKLNCLKCLNSSIRHKTSASRN